MCCRACPPSAVAQLPKVGTLCKVIDSQRNDYSLQTGPPSLHILPEKSRPVLGLCRQKAYELKVNQIHAEKHCGKKMNT